MSFDWRTDTGAGETGSGTAASDDAAEASIVHLGLGSNLGDRRTALAHALARIAQATRIEAVSPVYASAPVGYAEQPDFWNLVVRVRTGMDPRSLLAVLKSIEAEVGRTPSHRNGPREIDIDVLLYDDVIRADSPVIPHPRMHERAFVLRPLADLDDALRDPRDATLWTDRLRDVAHQRIAPVMDGRLLLEVE